MESRNPVYAKQNADAGNAADQCVTGNAAQDRNRRHKRRFNDNAQAVLRQVVAGDVDK